MVKKKPEFNNGWCFAIVNGRLAEIYFKKKWGVYAHCYIKKEEFTKREQKMIDADIKKNRFSYHNGFYRDKILDIKHKRPKLEDIFPRKKLK